jgi:hypothetical protein
MEVETLVGIITAATAISGTIITLVYSILRQRFENKKHTQQIDLENRRSNFEEKKLTIELYNQRELKLFEERLKVSPQISELLLPLTKRLLTELTPEKALELAGKIRECYYTKIYHCMSTEVLVALNALQSSLFKFSENKLKKDDLYETAIDVHRALHKDLGRTGLYLGGHTPQFKDDIQKHKSILE